jgi:hypothetical protein
MVAKARHALSERPKYYPSLFAFPAPQFQQPAQVEKSGRTQLFWQTILKIWKAD